MKKLLFAFALLFSFTANAQNWTRIRDEYVGTLSSTQTVPIFTPASYPASAIDTVRNIMFYRTTSTSSWRKIDGFYAATNLIQTQTNQPPQLDMGMIIVHPNGTDDTKNLKDAIALSKQTNRPIWLYGVYWCSADLIIDIDHFNLIIYGNGAAIRAKNTNAITFLNRAEPINNTQALDVGTNAAWSIQNLFLIGSQNQIGIDAGPGHGCEFDRVRFNGLNTAIVGRFQLNIEISYCYSINCINGFILTYGNWPDANNFNSQSNMPWVHGCEIVMPENGNVGISIIGNSGSLIEHCIIEGYYCVNAIELDATGSNHMKDFTVTNIHYECVRQAGNAFIKLRMTGNDVAHISNIYGQYPAIFLDVTSTSGLSYVEIAHVPWWRGKGDTSGNNGQGVMFKASNVTMHFEKNWAFNNDRTSWWEGTPLAKAGDGKEGNTIQMYGTWTINYMNPK